jgi:hypothetical protein
MYNYHMRAKFSLEERKRRRRERMKLLTTNMTTYGYAFAGSAFIDPVLKADGLHQANLILMAGGLALHCVANYLVPEGEKP